MKTTNGWDVGLVALQSTFILSLTLAGVLLGGCAAQVAPQVTPADTECAAPDFTACEEVPGESGRGARAVCALADGTEWERYDADPGLMTHYQPVPNTNHAEGSVICSVTASGYIIERY